MRIFLAVKAPGQLRDEVAARLDAVRGKPAVSWTDPATWHLTLQFLGEWPDERRAALQDALCGPVEEAAFELVPRGPGFFPARGAPRVFFLQLDGGEQAGRLASLVRRTVDRAWPQGPQDTKPFRPHLTLARIKRPLGETEAAVLRGINLRELPAWPVTGFSLMSSRLRPQGAEHRELAYFPLRK